MSTWFRRKLRDIRHAVQELRTGDSIDRTRSGVRTTIVGGRPPGDDTRVAVPMGIERVLRKAAIDEPFRSRLVADRESALDGSGLELTGSERAILLATPMDQLTAMVEQVKPHSAERRGFLRRAAAAIGMAVLGVAVIGCKKREPEAGGIISDMPPTKGAQPDRPAKTKGIQPDIPPERTDGIRPDMPEGVDSESADSDEDDGAMVTLGISPDMPPGVGKTRGMSADLPKE